MVNLGQATGRVASALPRSITGTDSFRGVYVLLLAAAIGIVGGLSVPFIGWLTRELHILLFGLHSDALLSEQYVLKTPSLALLPALGGVLMGLSIVLARRFRTRPPIDRSKPMPCMAAACRSARA
jgi:CIC family chloride channel protein